MKNFWNEEIMNIPVCQDLCNNWEAIRDEALLYLDKPHPYSKNKSSSREEAGANYTFSFLLLP